MALILNDRVKETSTTTGQGTLNLAGAATGFETFVTGIGDNNTTYYAIVHESDGTWEIGIGTVDDQSTDTLARTTVIDTSAGNTTKINFAAGSKTVFCTLPSSKAVFLDADGDVSLGANLDVAGTLTVTGTTTFNGGTLTLGDANTDNIVFGGEVDSDIIPDDDGAFDLGSSSKEWKDIYIDGVAYLDEINFNGTAISSTAAEINALDGITAVVGELNALDLGRTAIGTAIASKAVILDANKDYTGIRNLTITGELDGATLDISGDADIDGTTNLDVVDIDGAVDMATTLALGGNADFNGDLDVDGTTNLDNTDIDGTLVVDGSNISLDSTTTLNIDNSNTTNGITIATATSGVPISIGHSTSETTINDNLTVTGNFTVSGTSTTVNSTTVAVADAMFKLAKDQGTSADALDFGIYGQYGVGGTAKFAGLFRDVSATGDPFTFFDDLQAEPGTTVNTGGTGYDLADIVVGGLSVGDAITLGGTAITSTAAELNLVDGITAGTVSASLAVIVDSNKDITGFRNVTLTGELDAGSLDIEGDADINGTLETDALSIAGTTVTATAAELNFTDGVTSNIQTQLDTKTTPGFAVAMAIAL